MTREQQAELDRIANEASDKKLHPQSIVRAAASPQSPLHNCFEWNDGKAAHSFRVMQARQLIEVYVTHLPNVGAVRTFVSLRDDREKGGYTRTNTAMRNKVTRQLLLNQFSEDVRAVLNRYSFLRPVAGEMFAAIEQVLAPGVSRAEAGTGTVRQARQR